MCMTVAQGAQPGTEGRFRHLPEGIPLFKGILFLKCE